jgi:hypothetical protein
VSACLALPWLAPFLRFLLSIASLVDEWTSC